MIYLDHAATTPVKSEVLDAMLPYFSHTYSNASSAYASAREARKAIDRARGEVAAVIGAQRSEICFTSGGSEADNWAVFGIAHAFPDKRHIITTKIEHHAMLHSCQALEKFGYEITYLDADSLGRVSAADVRAAIRPDTALISVMLANNEVGTIEPVAEIAAIAHEKGVLMHTDAVQAVGHIPVDVRVLDVDLLSMSAHKFYGPKGVGALYIRSGTRIEKLIYGGAQERNMRAGTENTPAIVGMGRAIALAADGMQTASAHASQLRDVLQQELETIPGARINGDVQNRLPGHLHVSFDGANTALLLMQLDMAGIAASEGSACSSGSTQQSHVIRAMGLDGDNQADIRFSIGEANTEEDIARTAAVLRRILRS